MLTEHISLLKYDMFFVLFFFCILVFYEHKIVFIQKNISVRRWIKNYPSFHALLERKAPAREACMAAIFFGIYFSILNFGEIPTSKKSSCQEAVSSCCGSRDCLYLICSV